MSKNILEMRHIRKQFPGVYALSDTNFSVKEGEIHALVGENGAGKSTLMKILSGVYPKDTYEGEVVIDDKVMSFQAIKDSEKAGVAVIYQELALVKYMNISENIFLGNEILNKQGLIDWDTTFIRARAAMDQVGLTVNPAARVINLGIGTQQLVEIAKAVAKKARILVLDEPTSALTETEIEHLMKLLLAFKERGMTCIFISHKLKEVFNIADRITVLCDGKTVGTYNAEDLTEDKLISLMVGRSLTQRYPSSTRKAEVVAKNKVAMEVKNWTVYDPELIDKIALNNINFYVREGEILGIAGLMGAGRTETMLSILGVWGKKSSGEVKLLGKPVNTRTPSDLIRAGINYLSEDRKGSGLVLIQNVKNNMALPSLYSRLKMGLIDQDAELSVVEKMVQTLRIKTPSVEQLTLNLSGGNQQKVSLGKWLLTNPKVIILDEPTRGIDVGAKYEIYTIMQNLAEKGIAIIMISSELPEILGMSDRILVMHEGTVAGELPRSEASQEKIISLATGGK
ncbi:MAG: ATP-binding cassette domain-containing protein [Treponema sp.]|jgi:ABC-type sugar transport system ATPase subunit|nr:ATP-binding cassette domain-containing protein [Treponema sp.]